MIEIKSSTCVDIGLSWLAFATTGKEEAINPIDKNKLKLAVPILLNFFTPFFISFSFQPNYYLM